VTTGPSRETIRAALQQHWGYRDFRPPQGDIVQSILAGRDTLVIMPTGGGKSICFQLPALLQPGLTIVVSPLVALMENQVQELREKRLPAALIHSELSRAEKQATLRALERQTLRLLYLSPETLLSPPVWERLCQPNLLIHALILDEAHCLAQWGDTFRPAYYRLGAVRAALLSRQPSGSRLAIAAFTATADPETQATIQRILQLTDPQVFRLNPYRANLILKTQTVWTPRGRRQRLLKLIQSQGRQSGLVYVRTRRDSEQLVAWLLTQGYQTAAYHAGLGARDRRQIEQDWLASRTQFVICTSAFGMGVNHPTVRWVVHYHAPLLLAEYVQEVGRAGRDGKPAIALTLKSEPTGWFDPQDQQRRHFFEQQQVKQRRRAQALIKTLPPNGQVSLILKQNPDAALALSWLHGAGRLSWSDPFHYQLHPSSRSQNRGRTELANPGVLPVSGRQMGQFLQGRKCRWRFLLNAFGFTDESKGFRCGHCENCR
jgi:ATP-dependent DNA helicase RecQ